MVKANLAGDLRIGQCINYDGAVYRVVSKGQELSAFPGGIGVYETNLEYVQPYPVNGPLTLPELAKLEERFKETPTT